MISYAGVTLRMHTPEFAEVLDSVRFLEDAAAYTMPYEVAASTIDGMPKYGNAPPPRLNTLWWPAGATRWCQGWFLATEDEVRSIIDTVEGSEERSKAFLQISPDFSTSMWMLPPRRITFESTHPAVQSCWILPLVDDRYWWQFAPTPDDFEVTHDTTWDQMFSALETALTSNVEQILYHDIPAAYLQPDARTFDRQNYPAAVLLDAAAASVGRRLVRKLNGNYTLQTWAESETVLLANFTSAVDGDFFAAEEGQDLRLGGQSLWPWAAIPKTVRVQFGCEHDVIDKLAADLYTPIQDDERKPAAIGSITALVDRIKLVRTTALSGTAWDSATDALAEQIATDYYDSLRRSYHFVFQDVQRWEPTGYDDSVYWVLGCDQVTTTVQTVPPNLDVIDQYQQHANGNIPDEGWADLTENLEEDGTATADLLEWDDEIADYNDTTSVEITINSVGMIGYSGLRVKFVRNPDNCRIEMACCNRQIFTVKADSSVSKDASGTFSVLNDGGSDTGLNVTATAIEAFDVDDKGRVDLYSHGGFMAMPHPSEEGDNEDCTSFVTDVRIDLDNCKIQIEKDCSDTWTDITEVGGS